MKMLFPDPRYRSPTVAYPRTVDNSLVQFCKAYVVGEDSEAPGRSEIEFDTDTAVLALAARTEAMPGQMLRLLTQHAQGMIGQHWAWSDPELVFECDLALLSGRGTQFETKLEPFIQVHLPGSDFGANRLVIETDVRALVWLFGHRARAEKKDEKKALERAVRTGSDDDVRALIRELGNTDLSKMKKTP